MGLFLVVSDFRKYVPAKANVKLQVSIYYCHVAATGVCVNSEALDLIES